jgi:nucleoporin POM34
MSSTALLQSTSSNSLSRSNTSQSQLQSSATKAKNVITHPIAALTPQKGSSPFSRAHKTSPAISTPGKWQHPRMDEIVRRQNSSCFNPGDSRIVILNAAVFIFTFIAQPYLSSYLYLPFLSNRSS